MSGSKLPRQIGIRYFRMHIILPTGGGAIAEPLRHRLDGCCHLLCRGLSGYLRGLLSQRLSHQNRARPSAKILRGEVSARHGLPIVIHIARIYRLAVAVLIEILKTA